MKGKKLLALGLICLGVLSLAGCSKAKEPAKKPTKDTIETKIDVSSDRAQRAVLAHYPQVTKALGRVPENEQLIPIPGLRQAITFDLVTKKPTTCDAMTPQGVAIDKNNVYISAYCHDHQHNSVIYVMDRIKHTLIATIPVAGRPHLGGIVYEVKHQNLWLATETNHHASISALSAKTINRFGNSKQTAPVQYDKQLELPNVPRASLLSYLDPFLVVGYFDRVAGGELAMYPFDQAGNLTSLVEEKQAVDGLHDHNELVTDDTGKIIKETQGIAYYEHYMLLAQSYGDHDSTVYVIDLDNAKDGFSAASAFKKIKFPPYLEQITVSGDRLFAAFESGAKPYRDNTDRHTDHILQLDVKTLVKNHD